MLGEIVKTNGILSGQIGVLGEIVKTNSVLADRSECWVKLLKQMVF